VECVDLYKQLPVCDFLMFDDEGNSRKLAKSLAMNFGKLFPSSRTISSKNNRQKSKIP
jgi:hypothetical protein